MVSYRPLVAGVVSLVAIVAMAHGAALAAAPATPSVESFAARPPQLQKNHATEKIAALEAEVRWGLPFPWGDLLFPAAAAAAVIVLAEIIPKVAARLASERIALALAPVLSGATRFFGPLVRGLVDGTGKFVERLSSRVKAEGSWDPHVIRQMLETTSLSRATRSVVTGLLDFDRRLLTRFIG